MFGWFYTVVGIVLVIMLVVSFIQFVIGAATFTFGWFGKIMMILFSDQKQEWDMQDTLITLTLLIWIIAGIVLSAG